MLLREIEEKAAAAAAEEELRADEKAATLNEEGRREGRRKGRRRGCLYIYDGE